MISIRDTAAVDHADLGLARAQAVLGDVDAVLRLQFDDIGIPTYSPYCGPDMSRVVQALDFPRLCRADAPVAAYPNEQPRQRRDFRLAFILHCPNGGLDDVVKVGKQRLTGRAPARCVWLGASGVLSRIPAKPCQAA